MWSLRPGLVTTQGDPGADDSVVLRHLAVVAWATVITGTWIVCPWYRAALARVGEDVFAGCAGGVRPTGTCSPRDFLLSNVSDPTEAWHSFGMEWKEHVVRAAPPFLATAAAFLVTYYGARPIARPWLRAAVLCGGHAIRIIRPMGAMLQGFGDRRKPL